MTIRAVRDDDVPMLRDLVEGAYSPYVERIGRRPAPMDHDYAENVHEGRVFVADDGGIAGLIVLITAPHHLLIENVAVDPDRQGTGIGRALMSYAEAYARERGLSELRLYTNATMTENLTLYPHLGYTEVDRRTENGFQRVFFSKATTPS
ncbi:MAG TPA: GNAT family N-acetyltransferase [Solirubrobacteraceae bacterium]|jgi:ribosomal protein S18 acetylase RimI-like enzyme|nr:GNAT family N-acetyltransferase [Solirubrobacteraceae bacterium]